MDRKLIKECLEFIKRSRECEKIGRKEEKEAVMVARMMTAAAADPVSGLEKYKLMRDVVSEELEMMFRVKGDGNMLLARKPKRCSVFELCVFRVMRRRSRALALKIASITAVHECLKDCVSVLERYQGADEFVLSLEVMRVRENLVKVVRSLKNR